MDQNLSQPLRQPRSSLYHGQELSAQKPAFEQLYEEYFAKIYAFVRVQVQNESEAEDVTAQAFINAYQNYDRYEPRHDSPAAWLFRIARNASMDYHRRNQRGQRLTDRLRHDSMREVDPSAVAEQAIENRALLQAVAALPDRQRVVISLRHSGLSFAEAGMALGISEDAAKMLYHRAVKSLRQRLSRSPEFGGQGA